MAVNQPTKRSTTGLQGARPDRKPFNRTAIGRNNQTITRYMAWGVLALSFVASIIDAHALVDGGPSVTLPLVGQVFLFAVVLGVGAQMALTRVEFGSVKGRGSLVYVGAVCVDMTLNFLPMWWYLKGTVVAKLPSESAEFLAFLLFAVIAFAIARWPEFKLVEG